MPLPSKRTTFLLTAVLVLVLPFQACWFSSSVSRSHRTSQDGKSERIRVETSTWIQVDDAQILSQSDTEVLVRFFYTNLHGLKSSEASMDSLFLLPFISPCSWISVAINYFFAFLALLDPMIIQVPDGIELTEGLYSQGMAPFLSLLVHPMPAVPVAPGMWLHPEPGHHLYVVELPPDHGLNLPSWNQYDLVFEMATAPTGGAFKVKCIGAGKLAGSGQTFYPTLLPPVSDFATVPEITIPVTLTGNEDEILLPHAQDFDLPEQVEYDFNAAPWLLFPRLSHQPGQATEGFGFVNTGSLDIDTRLTAYIDSGGPVAGSDILTLGPGHQGAYQAEGLLQLSLATAGWVRAAQPEPGLVGFFLSQRYDRGNLVALDGADALFAATSTGVFPRVRQDAGMTTEIMLANTSQGPATVSFSTNQGDNVAVRAIPPMGMLQTDLDTLFPVKMHSGTVRVQSTGGQVVGHVTVRSVGHSLSSGNLIPLSEASQTLFAPHTARFGTTYRTELNLYNPGATDAPVTIRVYSETGQLDGMVQGVVPADGSLVLADGDAGLPAESSGWLRVDSAGGPLVGCIAFGDPATPGTYESMLPLLGRGHTETWFPHVAHGQIGDIHYFTGIAILNPPGQGAVTLTIDVIADNGVLLGTLTRPLASGAKYVRLLEYLEEIGQGLPPIPSGSIRVTANNPVIAFQLFGNHSDGGNPFLSAVVGSRPLFAPAMITR